MKPVAVFVTVSDAPSATVRMFVEPPLMSNLLSVAEEPSPDTMKALFVWTTPSASAVSYPTVTHPERIFAPFRTSSRLFDAPS